MPPPAMPPMVTALAVAARWLMLPLLLLALLVQRRPREVEPVRRLVVPMQVEP